ncbi:sensor histidine kinase [Leptolyngbya ohadii]|uniref:sensor histidine kinase n=1 Tax=Leptolyngbya ohadii TaxID=1962290 RepID=UPI000B59CDD4|nr:PAS domain S-box protein [Leptolyngbya ohadii]
MTHFGHFLVRNPEAVPEGIVDSLRSIAQRLDRLKCSLAQAENSDAIRAKGTENLAEQLQLDTGVLHEVADWVQRNWQDLGQTQQGNPLKPEQNRGINRVNAVMLRFRLYPDRSIVYDQRLGDWEAVYGYSVAEAEANPSYWLSNVHPEDLEAIVLPALDALMTEAFLSVEYRFCGKDGKLRWFQANLTSQYDASKNCWLITCIETDITQRKQNEYHLQQMQERFFHAFRASPLAISISRLADGCFVEVNDRHLELVDSSREELIGKTWVQLGLLQPGEWNFMMALLASTKGKPIEFWFHLRSGRRRLVRLSSETIDLNGEPHLLLLAEDLTDYRRVQADLQQLNEELESIVQQRTQELQDSQSALQTSQSQLRAVLDNSPMIIYLLDRENRHLMVNRRYEELVGLSQQELIGVPLEDIWASDDPTIACNIAAALAHIQQVRDTRKPIEVEEVLQVHQQKRIFFSNKFPLFNRRGELYAVGGICLDITERKRVEEERKRAEAIVAQREREYRTLVEHSPDMIIRLDREGRYLYVSPSFSRAFGLPPQDYLGKTAAEAGFPSDVAAICHQSLVPLFDRCEQQKIELAIDTVDGRQYHQSWAVPEIDEQGNVVSALIIGRDITQLKQAEQRLQQAIDELERLNRLKDEFLSTVSHELRTPVSNMRLSIRMLEVALQQAGFEPDARTLQYLTILDRECDREISLINDLLDLQRLEANKRELSLEPIDLLNWLPRLVEPFQERAQNRQQHLRLELPQVPLPILMSDADSLDRILAELLNNACKYTPPGEQIILRASVESQPRPQKILLSVHNSGTEVSADELPRIFDKFYRVPSADPWKQGGTGLGLALVKKLVEHLQGEIQVKSGKGTTVFTLTLPLHHALH